jgi:hypothetical protein
LPRISKRRIRNNEALLRISIALPKHPELEDLLDYVNEEVKRLLNAEGSVALLLDEEKKEFYVVSAAYDAMDTERKVKEVRFPMGELVAGERGENRAASDHLRHLGGAHLHEERDRKLGYKTRKPHHRTADKPGADHRGAQRHEQERGKFQLKKIWSC